MFEIFFKFHLGVVGGVDGDVNKTQLAVCVDNGWSWVMDIWRVIIAFLCFKIFTIKLKKKCK